VIGFYRGEELHYAARVRAGFVPVTRRQLLESIKGLEIAKKWPLRQSAREGSGPMRPSTHGRDDEGMHLAAMPHFGIAPTMSNAGLCSIGCCQCCRYCVQHCFVRRNQTLFEVAFPISPKIRFLNSTSTRTMARSIGGGYEDGRVVKLIHTAAHSAALLNRHIQMASALAPLSNEVQQLMIRS
jgi:hypothetical protein